MTDTPGEELVKNQHLWTDRIGRSIFYTYFLERFKKAHSNWTIVASSFTSEGNVTEIDVFEPNKAKSSVFWGHFQTLNALWD
ncbi:hypothetical protein L915_13557 [Phytophthora nicotianae]|uniref:Uncharacterized protein n=1 Tax=Phytophthora nicotianae TaxID=4792 RepID=W2GF40_PHYNI|nr:hypothetical protein L915_13557 [Phytophthora nicotianae]